MITEKEYWEEQYKEINPDTYDFSQSKPSAVLDDFCGKYLSDNAAVLDLGCGAGRNAHYLAQKGYRVYGADIAAGAVAFCRKRFSLHNLSGTFEQGTIDHIPFPDRYFESVICIAAIDHATFDTARLAMAEIRRVLTPNGMVLLTFDPPNTDDDLLDEAETLPDGTLRFIRGEQAGMVSRRYTDEDIKALAGEQHIISYNYTASGSRILVCRFAE